VSLTDARIEQIKVALLQSRGAISSIPRSLLWDKGLIDTIDAALANVAALREAGEDAGRWQWFASSPQTALMLGSDEHPLDETVDWGAECNRLADAAIRARSKP